MTNSTPEDTPSGDSPPTPPDQGDASTSTPNGDDAHIAMFSDPRFVDLKRTLLRFVVPASIAFMVWYLSYVLLSAYARDFMSTVLFGQVNIALVMGLGQFASTFLIAVAYSAYTRKKVDPKAIELFEELTEKESHEEARK